MDSNGNTFLSGEHESVTPHTDSVSHLMTNIVHSKRTFHCLKMSIFVFAEFESVSNGKKRHMLDNKQLQVL